MTKRDIAGFLGIDVKTIYNWEKNKPNLYETVMKGLAFEEAVKKAQQNADELKALEEEFKRKQ